MKKHISFQPTGSLLVGMAAGAALAPWAPWLLPRTSGRSSAPPPANWPKVPSTRICQLDKMVDNFVEQHMDS